MGNYLPGRLFMLFHSGYLNEARREWCRIHVYVAPRESSRLQTPKERHEDLWSVRFMLHERRKKLTWAGRYRCLDDGYDHTEEGFEQDLGLRARGWVIYIEVWASPCLLQVISSPLLGWFSDRILALDLTRIPDELLGGGILYRTRGLSSLERGEKIRDLSLLSLR